jgi:hypothetical protein
VLGFFEIGSCKELFAQGWLWTVIQCRLLWSLFRSFSFFSEGNMEGSGINLDSVCWAGSWRPGWRPRLPQAASCPWLGFCHQGEWLWLYALQRRGQRESSVFMVLSLVALWQSLVLEAFAGLLSWEHKQSLKTFLICLHTKDLVHKFENQGFFFFVLGIELKASHMLGKRSTTWATPPGLLFIFCCWDRVLLTAWTGLKLVILLLPPPE